MAIVGGGGAWGWGIAGLPWHWVCGLLSPVVVSSWAGYHPPHPVQQQGFTQAAGERGTDTNPSCLESLQEAGQG